MMWLKDLEPLYREADRFDREGLGYDYVPPHPRRLIDYWTVVSGIQGLDTFLTQIPPNVELECLRDQVQYIFLGGTSIVTLSDNVSQIHISIMHDPVIWLGDCTPEVQARWKELEQEVLRMS